jgi:hypothetical protein
MLQVRGTDLKPLQAKGARSHDSSFLSILKKLLSRDEARAAGIRKRCCAVLWRDQLMDSRDVRLSNSPGGLDGATEVETRVSNQHAQFLERLKGRGPSAYLSEVL